MASLRILLVEDSPTDALLLKSLLQQVDDFPFEMDQAQDLAGASKSIGNSRYEVIILDLGLPDSHGLTTYEKVRSQANDTPIIIVTGNEDRTMLNQAMNQGADNYLIKDAFDGNRIAVAILSAMRKRSVANN